MLTTSLLNFPDDLPNSTHTLTKIKKLKKRKTIRSLSLSLFKLISYLYPYPRTSMGEVCFSLYPFSFFFVLFFFVWDFWFFFGYGKRIRNQKKWHNLYSDGGSRSSNWNKELSPLWLVLRGLFWIGYLMAHCNWRLSIVWSWFSSDFGVPELCQRS